MNMRGKKALVIGLGKSGIAACQYLAAQGARVVADDSKLGHHDPKLVEGMDLIVVSPGVPLNLPLIQRARERKIPVISEMELALTTVGAVREPPLREKPIIAITGTNGKTTTTSLIAHLLKACGQKVCVAGNIGTPLIAMIDEARTSDWIVLEVSSFQLETTPSLHPQVAVWLNATPDHLDWHGSFEDYVAAKRKIFEQLPPDGYGIYNDRDEVVTKAVAQVGAGFKPVPTFIPFGRGTACRAPTFDFTKTKLVGVHNEENMKAAVLAVECCLGNDKKDIFQHALETFRPLPHRLEFVREVNGVRYYDDSKGTNVGATVKALESFTSPIILIAGGRDKGGSYDPLLPLVKKHVKHLIVIGEAAAVLQKTVGSVAITTRAASLEEAVLLAARTSKAGDVVLLSPACSSFDMFRDYAHRGEVFQGAVRSLGNTGKNGSERITQAAL
ncbi:MAG: UDP-N-acetylmuramoyl-L-alanine--D-glutamate ligase [Deltaproteobacteria bacterium]|nr:UDP-N-acetylmuramoyl-L-alanine--D-glutamate ligase [Deltaproteobacteria bacterium]